jgi:chaperonin GroES
MIEPRNDYVLIERTEVPEAGRIIIPEVAKEKSILGQVLAVGPGKRIEGTSNRRPMESKVGDIVFFNSKWSDFSGSHYSDDQLYDRNLHLVQEQDIFLKVGNARKPN